MNGIHLSDWNLPSFTVFTYRFKYAKPQRGEKDHMELSHRSSNRPTNTIRSRVEVLPAKSKPSRTGKRTVPSGIPGHPPLAIQLSGRWNSGRGGNRGCCCGCPACSCSGSPTDNSRHRCSNCRHGSRGSPPLSTNDRLQQFQRLSILSPKGWYILCRGRRPRF